MKKVFFMLTALAVLSSCSVTKSVSSKSLDIVGAGVVHVPIVVDLDVQEQKQELTMKFSNLKYIEEAKGVVLQDLLKKFDSDVLVEPTYYSETKAGTTTITVKGWPAKYKNFRKIEEKDVKFLELSPSYLKKANTEKSIVQTTKRK